MKKIQIEPSILSGDFGKLSEEAVRIEKSGADAIHIDIMDGQFVPNITLGPKAVAAINRSTSLFLDVHMMIYNPYEYVEAFVAAGADRLTFHFEATEDIEDTLKFIRLCDREAGLAFRPETPFDMMLRYLADIDVVLIMTVNPGFGGQKFMPDMLEKIRLTREFIDRHSLKTQIQVDGGIDEVTGRECVAAGANLLVSGEYLFKQPDLKIAVQHLKARVVG